MNKPAHDAEMLIGLCRGDSAVIRRIYEQYASKVQQWVVANSGNSDDARDVFQEGVQTLYESACDPDFNLRSSFEGLLFTICKRNWYGVLRRKKRWQAIREREDLTLDSEDDDAETVMIRLEEKAEDSRNLAATFAQLSDLCQQLLQLYAQGKSPEDIADALDMSGRNAVYQRRKACADRWKVLMKQTA